jgi:UDP-3-O-[3-hydroxymyristoyl] glucosamine N-acyltransferase
MRHIAETNFENTIQARNSLWEGGYVNIKISEILKHIDDEGMKYKFVGNANDSVSGYSSFLQYKQGTMTWVRDKETFLRDGKAEGYALIVSPEEVAGNFRNHIISDNARNIYFSVMDNLFEEKREMPPVGANTYISPDVKIGDSVTIGANCVLDGDISIGDNSIIYHNVSIINKVKIGCNAVIQSGVRIGHDGFGWFLDEGGKQTMIVHKGGVDIGNNVLISNNSIIYRGTLGDTILGDDCKIDGLCHIGHNVIMGKGVYLVAGTILYGSVICKDHSYVATGVIGDHTVLGEKSFVGMGSVVMRDVEQGETVVGIPARTLRKSEVITSKNER